MIWFLTGFFGVGIILIGCFMLLPIRTQYKITDRIYEVRKWFVSLLPAVKRLCTRRFASEGAET